MKRKRTLTTVVASGEGWEIVRVQEGRDVEFWLTVNNEFIGIYAKQPEAQAERDRLVYEQLERAA